MHMEKAVPIMVDPFGCRPVATPHGREHPVQERDEICWCIGRPDFISDFYPKVLEVIEVDSNSDRNLPRVGHDFMSSQTGISIVQLIGLVDIYPESEGYAN